MLLFQFSYLISDLIIYLCNVPLLLKCNLKPKQNFVIISLWVNQHLFLYTTGMLDNQIPL